MKKTIVPGILAMWSLSGCLKDELPVPAHQRGDAVAMEVCMGAGYEEQLWLDLRSGTIVSTNLKTAWDLAFESAPEGWHVMLNGSRLMTTWNIGPLELAQPTDTIGMAAGRHIDAPSGLLDSTAFGDWRGTNDVYVLDLGYGPLGQVLGLRKVRMVSADAAAYVFESAQLDGTGIQSFTVPKDATRAFTSFSFTGGVLPIEPVRATWDLVLTQYTHQFFEPFLPYIVTGALSSTTTRVARLDGATFAQVTLADTVAHPFSTHRDVIGYDWKAYSFDTGSYTVDPDLVYIVQDAEGFFYKLRFVDYYGAQGQVGCPRFEVVPL